VPEILSDTVSHLRAWTAGCHW